jgi:hypothetical protein
MYDSRLGYRVMEALRNHALHRGLPIQELMHSAWVVNHDDERSWHHSISLTLMLDQVRGTGGFKTAIVEELAKSGESVDLRPLVREYVAALAEIQMVFRGVTSDDFYKATYWIEELVERYQKEDGNTSGLAAVRRKDGRSVERVWVSRDSIERIKGLVARHSHMGGIERRFVTSEPG